MAEDRMADGTSATPGAHPYRHVGPATGDELSPIRQSLADWARNAGAAEETVEAIILATDEAASNAIRHAYPDGNGDVELRAEFRPETGRIEIVVRDHGRWQAPTTSGMTPDMLHGRGLPLIRMLAEQASIDPSATGTTVRMSWSLGGRGHQGPSAGSRGHQ